ncbi:peptidoglycan/LPS O-acetylase OafA/YrhL [Methanofollis sp. W23]|uniref:acyltransferase family protein n=1 Tax=Methanofollis sp. W23 TaxID=2817849 RepID=UPI001AE662FC|nr:acyltransferase family protein [Methanofollis sp. W23]MBP2145678.1 peptidoglycan/LPS O-acetylase OafA/YrhL [Methanofollis sp. W23]
MERILFLDEIKAFAILLVIFIHMQNFLSVFLVKNILIFEILKFIAVGCFTFASGYAIYRNNSNIQTRREGLHFYKKRIMRIYPLYLAALLVYFLCFQVFALFPPLHYSTIEWIATILSLQVLLAPYIEPIFTLWFIGFIMVMYALYPLFSRSSGKMRKRVILAASIFALLFILHQVLDIIDYRFFFYYFFFIAGIFAAEKNCRFLILERPLKRYRSSIAPAVIALSYASYCIFLFHMPVFAISGYFISRMDLPGYLQNGVVLFIVIPTMICLCYFVQRSYDAVIKNGGIRFPRDSFSLGKRNRG